MKPKQTIHDTHRRRKISFLNTAEKAAQNGGIVTSQEIKRVGARTVG